jgi:hypothetical protein
MKLALLGVDVESLRLAEAALAGGHEIVWPANLASAELQGSPWLALDPMLESDAWEDLLDSETADAIIIGRGTAGEDLRVRQVQELARMGRPMLVTFPLFTSVLTYFEVDMARTESEALLQHFNPLLEWPLLDDAAGWVGDGHSELGAVEQIICTRSLGDRSRERVLWHFARDVELLDRVAGGLDRVGAHAGAGSDAAAYAALSVQLLGSAQIPVRWAVEPPAGADEMCVTLVFERGRVEMTFNASDRFINLSPNHDDATEDGIAEFSPERNVVDRLAAAVESDDSAVSTWPDALHAMELTDSIEISLRRGRMIDVHHQQLTEHLAFKGTMAAAGCGVILVLVPLMFVAGLIAGQFGVPVAQFVPHALLALLVIFLGLQLLPKLLYSGPSSKD